MDLTHRVATLDDLDAIRVVVRRAIEQLQADFLPPEQVAASHEVMGVDTQLLRDGTYILLLAGDRIAGCGGWSYRRTLFGGDASVIVPRGTAGQSGAEGAVRGVALSAGICPS